MGQRTRCGLPHVLFLVVQQRLERAERGGRFRIAKGLNGRDAYVNNMSDADLSRELGYRRFTGEPYSLPLDQQILHVVNHATLHRGQVVGMIRQLGIAPPSTDLLFYLMEICGPSER